LEILIEGCDPVAMLNCGRRQISITKVHIRLCDALQRVKHARTVVNLKHVGLE
jgi:hypothetical protein